MYDFNLTVITHLKKMRKEEKGGRQKKSLTLTPPPSALLGEKRRKSYFLIFLVFCMYIIQHIALRLMGYLQYRKMALTKI